MTYLGVKLAAALLFLLLIFEHIASFFLSITIPFISGTPTVADIPALIDSRRSFVSILCPVLILGVVGKMMWLAQQVRYPPIKSGTIPSPNPRAPIGGTRPHAQAHGFWHRDNPAMHFGVFGALGLIAFVIIPRLTCYSDWAVYKSGETTLEAHIYQFLLHKPPLAHFMHCYFDYHHIVGAAYWSTIWGLVLAGIGAFLIYRNDW